MGERIWRCSCHGPHFLVLDEIDGETYLRAESYSDARTRHAGSIRQRVAVAWKMLRFGHAEWIELILTPDVKRELLGVLLSVPEEGTSANSQPFYVSPPITTWAGPWAAP
jgi:hypothetical protein